MPPADAEELGAEVVVAVQVLLLQPRSLGGDPVGPTQDRQLFAERSRGPGEPSRRVVRALVAHKPDLQVQRGNGGDEICIPG